MFLLCSRISELMFVFLSAMETLDARGTEVVTVETMRSLSMIVELIRELVRLIGGGKWARRSISFVIGSVTFIATTVDGDFERLLRLRDDLLDGEDLLLLLE